MKNKAIEKSTFVGVDLHTNRFTTFYITPKERYLKTFELSDLDKFLATIDKNTFVSVEASCNTFKFCDRVKRVARAVIVANPYKLRLISMVNKKTDKVDAEKLAMFLKNHVLGGEELIEPVYVPDQSIRNLRSLFVTYKNIQAQVVMTKNRIHALLKQNMILIKTSDMTSKVGRKRIKLRCAENQDIYFQIEILFDTLDAHEKTKSALADQIYRSAKSFRKEIDILTSLPGISVLTACALIADIGDIRRFKSAKKLASYLRSAPGVDSSNEVTKIKKTSKFGRRLSIELLIQAVTHFKNAHPNLAAWHAQMVERKKSPGKVRIGICRKVICQIFHMLTKSEYHFYRNETLHREKMEIFDRFVATTTAA